MRPFIAFLNSIGWPELVVILVIVLVLFGPRRLPEIFEAFGKSVRKFKEASRGAETELKKEIDAAKEDTDKR